MTPPDEVVGLAAKLSEAQKGRLAAMDDGEMSAASLGATSSDSSRLMREFNRNGQIITRKYVGGRNRYRLTPLGLRLRSHLIGTGNG